VQAFQTIVGKNGWPSTRITSPSATVRSAPVSPGVLSRNGADAPRPSSARASTDTRYAVSKISPVQGGDVVDGRRRGRSPERRHVHAVGDA